MTSNADMRIPKVVVVSAFLLVCISVLSIPAIYAWRVKARTELYIRIGKDIASWHKTVSDSQGVKPKIADLFPALNENGRMMLLRSSKIDVGPAWGNTESEYDILLSVVVCDDVLNERELKIGRTDVTLLGPRRAR